MTIKLDGWDIICLSSSCWEGNWGTQHQMMWRLSAANRVLFVEVPISPLTPFTGLKKEIWLGQLKRVGDVAPLSAKERLIIASPPPVLPFRYHKLTNRINQAILFWYIDHEATLLKIKKPIVVTFQADSAYLVSRIDAGLRIYYCADDWSQSGRWWQPPQRVREREKELIASCDFVVATSRTLVSRLEESGKPTFFIPNAVDYRLFGQAPKAMVPEEMRLLKRPVIGFAGIMSRHSFDPNLILWLSERHSDWEFAIIGRKIDRAPDLSMLEKAKNVHFIKYQPIENLPQYLAAMDVCLIPWAQTEWTKSAFSLKLFEYLAVGKPVVASWTDEYIPYKDLIYMARNYEEFEACISRALKENDQGLTKLRKELAKANSWDQRSEVFYKITADYLSSH